MHGEKVNIINLSATSSGVSNIKNIINKTKTESKFNQIIVIMDKIHRFNSNKIFFYHMLKQAHLL